MSEKKIVLEAEGISRTYPGEVPVPALKTCSVSFREGEFVSVIGKSGSGKSTLLRILGTLDIADTGEVKIAGQEVSGMKDRELAKFRRNHVGFIYQDYNLFDEYTGYENIILPIHLDGRREDKKKVLEIIDKLGIEHCKDKFPEEMSGGEQQRVAIARALVTEPAVIFADEPTGNLDAENAEEVAGLLRSASDIYQQTIVMVTHDSQMADYADRILQIKDGVLGES